jgi:hypothetical protein
MVQQAAVLLDAKDPRATMHCAMAKRFATDTGFEVCNKSLQIFGGYGQWRKMRGLASARREWQSTIGFVLY